MRGTLDLPNTRARNAEGLAKHFRYFGEVETPRMNSGVYTAFSLSVADDPDLLALVAEVDPGQPAPNVLFASVQDLLLEDAQRSAEARALSRFFPAVSGEAIPVDSPVEAFRNFCLAHRSELIPKLRSGRTQTCVVHRCTTLLPAIGNLPRVAVAGGRVGLLEIGPSAGLNLRLDRYRYVYRDDAGREVRWGEADAHPILECSVLNGELPPVPGALDVVARRGLDLNPIDLADPEELRWLRALIWPEHIERAQLMDQAIALAEEVPIEIEAGDATRDLEAQIEKLPADAPRVLFATHVFYQIPREGLIAILESIARASRSLPVDLIVMESTGEGDSRIDWFAFEEGERKSRTALGRSDSHGRSIEWGRQA